MQILTDLRQIPDSGEQVVRHVLGVVRDELNAVDAFDIVQGREKVTKPPAAAGFFVAVAVNSLAEERDFAAAFSGELATLGDDRGRRSALLGAADTGDDAVRAELIAADHDPDVRLVLRGSHRGVTERIETFVAAFDLGAVAVLAAEADFHALGTRRAFCADFAYERGHLVQLAGADDQINIRGAFEDDALVVLRHAAEDANYRIRMFALGVFQPAEGAVDLVFRVLADATCIEKYRVGVVRIVRQLVTVFAQAGDDELAVEFVHLAADGFDVQFHGDWFRLGGFVFGFGGTFFAAAGVDLALDVGDEGVAATLHEPNECHHRDVDGDGKQGDVRARHL